jgi:hypothetical protein
MSTTPTRRHGQLSDKVLELCRTLQRLVAEAKKETRLSADYWDPLAAFIALDEFERVASDYESFVPVEASDVGGYDASPFARRVLRWPEYVEVMSQWALSPSLWAFTVQRVAELPRLVYLELEERSQNGPNGAVDLANSLSVYEFNEEGKVHRLRLAVADFGLRPWPICSNSSGVTAAQ